ncbi:porin [Aquincola sp. MAHUQ-54]|uniref:Porin n=1 Tax=Aquincola agrisoli TaxID=3119538 RepID=A0AAW9QM04_9BURK
MKRSLLCFAALAAVAGTASAQSSVTVFGILDAGVRYVKNGDRDQVLLSSGGVATSRLGFRGTEDLGGGLKAGFWLESQVNVDAGTSATKFWHRRSTVSLSGNFGEVRLGRDFSPTYRVATASDPFSDTGIGAIANVFSASSINGGAYATHTRLDNSVSYFLPATLGGFYGQLTAAAGEGASGTKLYGGLIGYKAGPLDVSAGYSETEVTDDDNVKYGALAAAYDFGMLKLMGGWSQLKYIGAKENHYNIGALVPLGSGTVRASYVHSEGKGGAFTADGRKNEADLFAIGYVHDLSKRTAVYSNFSYIKNKGGAQFVVSGGPALNGGDKSRGLDVGIKHSF